MDGHLTPFALFSWSLVVVGAVAVAVPNLIRAYRAAKQARKVAQDRTRQVVEESQNAGIDL